MFVIGITGPSGSGKGVASSYLSSRGIKIIDADKVYHAVIAPPSRCLDELEEYFGNDILNSDGTLARKKLSEMVFGDDNSEKLKALNEITHKYVVAEIISEIAACEGKGERACVIDAPLLIESGLADACNIVVAVIADTELRITRIINRDGITDEKARLRVLSQKSDGFYAAAADIVIYNNGSKDMLEAELCRSLSERGVEL